METPENSTEDASLLKYAQESVRSEIVRNLGRLADGYFTLEELAAAEITNTLSEPDSPRFPDDRLTNEDILNILTNMRNQAVEEVLEDQIDELDDSGVDEDETHFEQERLEAARQALVDYLDVKLFTDTGMSQDEAVAEVLKLRQSDIHFLLSFWRSSYKAAKKNGFAVPSTLEEWAHLGSMR